jgi:hypothetical protein
MIAIIPPLVSAFVFTDLVNVSICPESAFITCLLSSLDWMHGQVQKGRDVSYWKRMGIAKSMTPTQWQEMDAPDSLVAIPSPLLFNRGACDATSTFAFRERPNPKNPSAYGNDCGHSAWKDEAALRRTSA